MDNQSPTKIAENESADYSRVYEDDSSVVNASVPTPAELAKRYHLTAKSGMVLRELSISQNDSMVKARLPLSDSASILFRTGKTMSCFIVRPMC